MESSICAMESRSDNLELINKEQSIYQQEKILFKEELYTNNGARMSLGDMWIDESDYAEPVRKSISEWYDTKDLYSKKIKKGLCLILDDEMDTDIINGIQRLSEIINEIQRLSIYSNYRDAFSLCRHLQHVIQLLKLNTSAKDDIINFLSEDDKMKFSECSEVYIWRSFLMKMHDKVSKHWCKLNKRACKLTVEDKNQRRKIISKLIACIILLQNINQYRLYENHPYNIKMHKKFSKLIVK